MTKRFLIADDFSSSARAAAALALDDLRTEGGTLALVHVFLVPIPLSPTPDMPAENYLMLEQQLLRDAKLHLSARADELRAHLEPASRIEITGDVRIGTAADEILQCAHDTKADRIYVGSHGRRGLAHFFLGSVAERVARLSRIPVTIAKSIVKDDAKDSKTSPKRP